jgi:hypothetical protein
MPAINVFPVGSVGSSARLAIEGEACLSVSAFHVAPPSVVRQMPPLTPPMNIVCGPSAGSSRIVCTAPATVPFGGASPLCTTSIGPNFGEGPCGMKV